jgi:SAM-dependent methyltransferase
MALKHKRGARVAALVACLVLMGCNRSEPVAENVVPTSIAEPYAADPANLELWLERLEVGSREIYSARAEIAKAVNLKPGDRIADIGAGTGIYSMLFAETVGSSGAVYAVDIEPRFLKLINQRAEDNGHSNVVSVLSRTNSITLPEGSVDAVFICDTYHYFEDPATLMATVKSALKPGGSVYIVDYEIVEGAAPPADHRHVRFGKAGVAAEIESFGFGKGEDVAIPGLSDNYMLRFRKS